MQRVMWTVLGGLLCLLNTAALADETATLSVNIPAALSSAPPVGFAGSAGSPKSSDGFVSRYGLNLGGPSAWGAEQLLSNIVANPGFEPVLERSLVKVAGLGERAFTQTGGGPAREPGFWTGASAVLITGALADQTFGVQAHGELAGSQETLFQMDRPLPGLKVGDMAALTRLTTGGPPARWWTQGFVQTRPSTPVQGSGVQVVALKAIGSQAARLSTYVDTLERAGRLLPVRGQWRLSFRVKRLSATPATVRARFAREGQTVFMDQVVTPDANWSNPNWTFKGTEAVHGKGPLSLSFSVEQGEVALDDVYLGEASPGAGGFRQAVVETLKALQPGYLRDWQGQLGDTTRNRFAPSGEHAPVRYRAGESEILHTYTVPQTLALCQATGAVPWLVVPTTMGAEEATAFAQQLHQHLRKAGLSEVVIEFGNENWNPLFEAGGLVATAQHAEAIERTFGAMSAALRRSTAVHPKGERALSVKWVANARVGDTEAIARLARLKGIDSVAIAPYFAYAMEAGQSLDDALQAAFFPSDEQALKGSVLAAARAGKALSAYELNFHTTEGRAAPFQRNTVVAGAASGPALAARLLVNSLNGLQEQVVYALAGYDAYTSGQDLVRLFGVTRDLSVAARLRPTGVALGMLNRVMGGNISVPQCAGSGCADLVSVAIEQGHQRWAMVNRARSPQTIRLAKACRQGLPVARVLDGSDALDNNEYAEAVKAMPAKGLCQGSDAVFTLPAHSLLTVE